MTNCSWSVMMTRRFTNGVERQLRISGDDSRNDTRHWFQKHLRRTSAPSNRFWMSRTTSSHSQRPVGREELTAVGDAADASDGIATITVAEDDEEQAEQIATAIGHLLTGSLGDIDETYDAGDIALLVRKNRHAKPIVRALEERGIPYQLAGGLAADSVGVETVLAYLKALANPADEVSLNRVLTMRYRLHDADLRLLNTASDSLSEALRRFRSTNFVNRNVFNEPAKISRRCVPSERSTL